MSAPNYIMSLGVGWLALLILTWGQCEGLTAGIGAEELTPTSFFISRPKLIIDADLGGRRQIKILKNETFI